MLTVPREQDVDGDSKTDLSHDGLKRHDDADLFFKVLSQRVSVGTVMRARKTVPQ